MSRCITFSSQSDLTGLNAQNHHSVIIVNELKYYKNHKLWITITCPEALASSSVSS